MTGRAARLQSELARLGGWPAPCVELERVDSTNAELRRRVRAGAPPWSALVAGEQTEGRGRHGRTWHSPPGNLYLSVLLPAPAEASRASLRPLLGGLACAEALAAAGVPTCLKWPNDVLDPATERKLAGVLVEGTVGGAGLEYLVMGVGVNLIGGRAALPAALRDRVAVARDAGGATPERPALAASLLVGLRALHEQCERDGGADALQRWRARSVRWWGRPVEVTSGEERLVGVAHALAPDGALILELADGRRQAVVSGEARELRPSESRLG